MTPDRQRDVDGAADDGVEQGGGDAAVNGAERVGDVGARLHRYDDPTVLELVEAHAEQSLDRRPVRCVLDRHSAQHLQSCRTVKPLAAPAVGDLPAGKQAAKVNGFAERPVERLAPSSPVRQSAAAGPSPRRSLLKRIEEVHDGLAAQGLRVLAVAYRAYDDALDLQSAPRMEPEELDGTSPT